MGHSPWFINEHSDNWMAFRAGNFDVYQLESVVDRDLFGNFNDAICNRA